MSSTKVKAPAKILKTHEVIRNRLKKLGKSFSANDNISNFISNEELALLQVEVEQKISELLECLVIDTHADHNTHETHKRVAKMYIQEIFKGRYHEQPEVTDFPNAKNLDQVYTVGPISVRSTCSHHMVPIIGKCWIGIKPTQRVIGLSKFNRIADWVLSRPQIQEEATIMLADVLTDIIKPDGLAVIIKANHICMSHRGVMDSDTEMVTSVMRGVFRRDGKARSELMDLIKSSGF